MRSEPRMALLCAAVLLASCTTNDGTNTRAQGAGFGALIGAAAGAAIGGNPRSALIGAAAGGGAGLVAGDQVARKKQKYAQREDELRDSAARAHRVAAQIRQQNGQTAGEVAHLQQNVRSLSSRQLSEQQRLTLNRHSHQQAGVLLNQVNGQLQKLHEEIQRQQSLANDSKQASGEGLHQVSLGIKDLESSEQGLLDAKAQLELLDSRRAY